METKGVQPAKTNWARPIDTPPFYGYELRPGVTFTYLGFRVGPDAMSFGGLPVTMFGLRVKLWLEVSSGKVTSLVWYDYWHCVWTNRGKGGWGICKIKCWMRRNVSSLSGNACRYCEGFCSAFKAMTRYRAFDTETVIHMSNLCHNCQACYHSCQYTMPHEFELNLPNALANVRVESWSLMSLFLLYRSYSRVVLLCRSRAWWFLFYFGWWLESRGLRLTTSMI